MAPRAESPEEEEGSKGAEERTRPGSGAPAPCRLVCALPLALLIKGSPGDKRWPTDTMHGMGASLLPELTTGVLSALWPMSPLVLLSHPRHCGHATVLSPPVWQGYLVRVEGAYAGLSQGRPKTRHLWRVGDEENRHRLCHWWASMSVME